MTNPKIIKLILKIIAVVIVLGIFASGGFVMGKISDSKINFQFDEQFIGETPLADVFNNTLVKQVWGILSTDYVDKENLDQQKMFYGAIAGMVDGIGDPYTTFFEPKQAEEFAIQIAGNFEGIGAQLGMKDNVPTVIAPLPETPAERAGILAGDMIVKVDGKDILGKSLDEVISLIRGEHGTTVTLTIVRGQEDPKDYTMTRDKIQMKSVKWEIRPDGLAYVAMSGFNEDTVDLFNQAVKELKQKNCQGLILDLRNDPGGLLDVANEVTANWFTNDVIVSEKFGDGRKIDYNAGSKAVLKGMPTVVLVNEGSASAAEILSGALQDYGLAKLVGTKTFGKGSVQALRNLPDGSSLKVTVAKWITPKGREINNVGIEPDVKVEYTRADFDAKKDPQLDKAVEILLEKK